MYESRAGFVSRNAGAVDNEPVEPTTEGNGLVFAPHKAVAP